MKKPQLCLSLTLSLALLQAYSLQASASPGSAAIWEKLAGASQTSSKTSQKPAKKKAPQVVRKSSTVQSSSLATTGTFNASGIAHGSAGQVALFFGKDKDASPATKAPGAALTIHSSMSEQEAAPVATAASAEQPKIVAMDTSITSDAAAIAPAAAEMAPPLASKPAREAKTLLAQLAPDQILADSGDAAVASTPIPPVVSGTVDLEEFKPSN
ncbi:MAG: hypothetical protein K2X81_23015, partial [Candidatus Obscuribacterales bacterium]|nr:hypothetical protein [Candidatus Obscuribacterales bacterium]